jgi:membrane protease YdiL (CAAX protease family)
VAGQIANRGAVSIEAVLEGPRTWRVREAALIGFASFSILLILLFVSTEMIRRSSLAPFLSEFQARQVSTLVSLVATALIVGSAVAFAKRQGYQEWWKSIAWNADRYTRTSIASGAVLGLTWSLCVTSLYDTGTSFHGKILPLSITLYLITGVVLSPILEEIYFRGVLFLALANRFGPAISIAVVTLLFVLVHPGHMFVVLPVSVALGVARLKTGSVASCFALHASYNLFLLVYRLFVMR